MRKTRPLRNRLVRGSAALIAVSLDVLQVSHLYSIGEFSKAISERGGAATERCRVKEIASLALCLTLLTLDLVKVGAFKNF